MALLFVYFYDFPYFIEKPRTFIPLDVMRTANAHNTFAVFNIYFSFFRSIYEYTPWHNFSLDGLSFNEHACRNGASNNDEEKKKTKKKKREKIN